MNKFLMFTKDSCGPCGLVKRYIKALKDDRSSLIEEVELEDFSDVPIPQANLDIAKKYGITATPVLIVIDENGDQRNILVVCLSHSQFANSGINMVVSKTALFTATAVKNVREWHLSLRT